MTDGDQRIPETLPLLDALVAERVGAARPLAGVTTILIQHQLGCAVPMTRTLIRLGVEPAHIFWLDIPYTANAEVRAALEGLGIPEGNFAPATYRLDMPYAGYQRARAQQLAMKFMRLRPATDQILVLDDGSYFLEALSCFASRLPFLRIVEQTTRGIIKINADPTLRDYCENVTILNVAQSGPKKNIEGPLIGHAVGRSLLTRLEGRLPRGRNTRCLVLGFGQIGQAVVRSLGEDLDIPLANIHVTDPQPRALARAAEQGFGIWDRDAREHRRFDLVVGCSGTTSFAIGDRISLENGAVLISASSGSAELSRDGFIEFADTHPADDIYVYEREALAMRPIHSDIDIHLVDRDARFLNGGFPVNFDGRVNCVPPRLIQATHALQIGAALEAMTAADKRGLVDPSEDLCRWVETRYRETVGDG